MNNSQINQDEITQKLNIYQNIDLNSLTASRIFLAKFIAKI